MGNNLHIELFSIALSVCFIFSVCLFSSINITSTVKRKTLQSILYVLYDDNKGHCDSD